MLTGRLESTHDPRYAYGGRSPHTCKSRGMCFNLVRLCILNRLLRYLRELHSVSLARPHSSIKFTNVTNLFFLTAPEMT